MAPLALLILALALSPPVRALGHPDGAADDPAPTVADERLDPGTFNCLMLSEPDCSASSNATPILTAPGRPAPAVFTSDSRAFSALLAAYPGGGVDEVKGLIGRPREDWIVNTCAIRVSYAMNSAGFKIDNSVQDARAASDPKNRINFLSDRSGVRLGHFYLYRVDELARYLLQKYGKPPIWIKAEKGSAAGVPRGVLQGKKGVVLFVVKSWSDATGHFDLWDGSRASHEDYFDKASDVFLWQ